ncbi:hypothetical protein SDRG_11781 [Saprolegnia diclina VS20]|uniref:Uncharacterized protein n=1 Tax=Saprolegnia diclina (strain VS20) TaxID=1156394 RepID=T0RDY5_SAPDV|nr:hypothetical protein SDRG_11781 [Saprolegnia diclina VS20]EQC30463.1 hypothetical protein SDRG_11781 [Saprolegnia diclina VS20]|eukprot:XP_008616056.1 hypothetical protein SDRG_11781 [Saprolegnia diclina VS20]
MSIASQGRPMSEWAPIFAATLAALETHGGAASDEALSVRWNYASALERQHDIPGALREHLKLFELQRHKFGLGDARTAETMSCVGRDYNQLFMPRVAARWLQKALAVEDATLGADHHATISTILSLAGALAQQGKVAQALSWTKRLVATSDRTLGPENTTTMVSKINVAILELMAGNTRDAMTQLLRLEALMADRPTVVDFLAHVQEALGLAHWADGNVDAAATAFAQALTNLPCKQMAWSFFRFCATVPTTALDNWHHVRRYLESTDDPAPETWPASCLNCYKPIVGGFVACAACPTGHFPFCTTCAMRNSARLGTFCTHEPRAFQSQTTLPPRRYFLQEKLVSIAKATATSFVDLDAAYCAYDAYCATHDVPRLERLPRMSVEGLNRDWHPML